MFNEKWDLRFLELAKVVASWSKDPSTQTGAIIVRPDKTIVSVGFNGFAQSMPDNSLLYDNREEKYSRIIHCEMNALLRAFEIVSFLRLYSFLYCFLFSIISFNISGKNPGFFLK